MQLLMHTYFRTLLFLNFFCIGKLSSMMQNSIDHQVCQYTSAFVFVQQSLQRKVLWWCIVSPTD